MVSSPSSKRGSILSPWLVAALVISALFTRVQDSGDPRVPATLFALLMLIDGIWATLAPGNFLKIIGGITTTPRTMLRTFTEATGHFALSLGIACFLLCNFRDSVSIGEAIAYGLVSRFLLIVRMLLNPPGPLGIATPIMVCNGIIYIAILWLELYHPDDPLSFLLINFSMGWTAVISLVSYIWPKALASIMYGADVNMEDKIQKELFRYAMAYNFMSSVYMLVVVDEEDPDDQINPIEAIGFVSIIASVWCIDIGFVSQIRFVMPEARFLDEMSMFSLVVIFAAVGIAITT